MHVVAHVIEGKIITAPIRRQDDEQESDSLDSTCLSIRLFTLLFSGLDYNPEST